MLEIEVTIPTYEIGKDYKTLGGWKARCIWIQRPLMGHTFYYFIHMPGGYKESCPIAHDYFGRPEISFGVDIAPDFGKHPANIVGPWEETSEVNN